MLFKSKQRVYESYQRRLTAQHDAAERWQDDWRKVSEQYQQARMKLDFLRCLDVHTDAEGKRFVYLPDYWITNEIWPR